VGLGGLELLTKRLLLRHGVVAAAAPDTRASCARSDRWEGRRDHLLDTQMPERRLPATLVCRGIGVCSVVTDSTRLGTYCSNCNVTLTAMDRLRPSKNR
jgi:hypothetical protein